MKKLKIFILMIMITLGLNVFAVTQQPTRIPNLNLENPLPYNVSYQAVNPLDVVAKPNFYLNKNIMIKAKFDKFSTLGLDYKPAFKSSEDYISFLIRRPDVTNHNVPLSEMKIFLKRTEAEKYIDLNSGDDIEFCGKVFSNALGDVWINVDKFTVLSSKPKTTEK